MNRTTVFALLTAAAISACATATPEQQIVDDAAAALGGRDRVLAVKTLVIEGEGSNGNLGQDMTPEATGQKFALSGYKRIDRRGGRPRRGSSRRARRTSPTSRARRRRSRCSASTAMSRYNVAAERQRDARLERGGAGSAGGHLSPPDHDCPRRARPRRQARESADRRRRARRRGHDRQRTHLHAGDRQHHRAADARGVDVRERQHG